MYRLDSHGYPAKKPGCRVEAEPVLDRVENQSDSASAFFRGDQTLIVGFIVMCGRHDPQTFFLLDIKKGSFTIDNQFKRLLAIEHLALLYDGWLARTRNEPLEWAVYSNRFHNYVQWQAFIHEQRLLNTCQCRGWVESGQKLRKIERETCIPGISLALIPELPRILHLCNAQFKKLISILKKEGSYPKIKGLRIGALAWADSKTGHERGKCGMSREG
ncbi:uncharacterized protein ACHE_10982S [Aspergillus chevalieri]|uniref:Uncharacterized protein n=1 Tax=Aspergillus chevalieri TaxID=182096 RepID=A0A7R7VEZ0_ASPCH|nr:uncharacterized protein ACHE_10982S [Aspergillus chevalieri]BCR83580.1 hypothetical protein ACHE_10982S [Aspergillus chevalieri]